ncbi:MAG: hypothetical protein HYX54_02675 [Chloroflexi bacterium]|nr:hypothetical protein [Chloroflexota bacterium]
MSDPVGEAVGDLAVELAEAIEGVASSLDPRPSRGSSDGATVWSIGGSPIASLFAASASFRVGPEIGAAARNTPDAAASPLGRDWVAFSPPRLDGHALDRLVAWFGAAYRRAR